MFIPDVAVSNRRARGMTMIELLMFIVIIGIALAGILQLMALVTKTSADPQMRKQALSIAESLLEEVELAHFTYCDPTDTQAGTATTAAVGPPGTGCVDAAHVETAKQEAVPGAVGRPYDNVNDYASAGYGTPVTYTTDAAGTAFNWANPTEYKATVTITQPVAPAEVFGGIVSDATDANTNVLRITVTVTYNNGNDSITLDGYRTRYAPQYTP